MYKWHGAETTSHPKGSRRHTKKRGAAAGKRGSGTGRKPSHSRGSGTGRRPSHRRGKRNRTETKKAGGAKPGGKEYRAAEGRVRTRTRRRNCKYNKTKRAKMPPAFLCRSCVPLPPPVACVGVAFRFLCCGSCWSCVPLPRLHAAAPRFLVYLLQQMPFGWLVVSAGFPLLLSYLPYIKF